MKQIYKESLISFNMLQKLLGDRVTLNNNYEVLIDYVRLVNEDNKILLQYNKFSKRIRRKNKSLYRYLNFYEDSHILVQYFLSEYNLTHISVNHGISSPMIQVKLYNDDESSNYIGNFIHVDNKSDDYYITEFIKSIIFNN